MVRLNLWTEIMSLNAGTIEYTVSVETQQSIDAANKVNASLDKTEKQMKDTAGGAKKLTGGESRKRNAAGKRILPQKRRIQQETKHSSGNIVRFPMTLRNRHTG